MFSLPPARHLKRYRLQELPVGTPVSLTLHSQDFDAQFVLLDLAFFAETSHLPQIGVPQTINGTLTTVDPFDPNWIPIR